LLEESEIATPELSIDRRNRKAEKILEACRRHRCKRDDEELVENLRVNV
jgi:hypothetical protein